MSSFTWKSQWKDSPTSGHPMEPCGSGSLHARSRVMLHLNSHSSRDTTSSSTVGRTAAKTICTVDTRQKSCPNIFNEEQCQNERGNPMCFPRCFLDGAPPKVAQYNKGPFTRSFWISRNDQSVWSRQDRGFMCFPTFRAWEETDNYSKQFYKLRALACLSSEFIHLFQGCNPWETTSSHPSSDCKSHSNWTWNRADVLKIKNLFALI